MRRTLFRLIMVAVVATAAVMIYVGFTQPVSSPRPAEQAALYDNVPSAIQGPPPMAAPVENGEALAYMKIKRFGSDWLWTTLEGVDEETLTKGPGHYPNTPLPGEDGNTSFAAHRSSHGDPFLDFDKLQVGDVVFIAQSGAWWEYTIKTKPKIINSNAGWVTEEFKPGKWLTLTTCWPKYGNEKRMYVRAELTDHS